MLLLVAGLGLLGYAGARLSPPHYVAGFEALLARPADDGPAAVALGNSHAIAIDFAAMGVDGIRVWQGGADPFEIEVLATLILERYPSVRTILMPVSPEFLLGDHAGTAHPSRMATYDHLFALSRFDLLERDALGWLRWAGSHLRRSDQWRPVAQALAAGGRPPTGHVLTARANPLEEGRVARAARRMPENLDLPRRGSQARLDRSLDALGRLAEAAAARGVRLVLLEAPVAELYRRRLDAELDRYGGAATLAHAMFRHWQAEMAGPCLHRLDGLWSAPDDGARSELYLDPGHLGPRGAQLFSRRLADRIDGWEGCAAEPAPGAVTR